jgi:hypothetical protein
LVGPSGGEGRGRGGKSEGIGRIVVGLDGKVDVAGCVTAEEDGGGRGEGDEGAVGGDRTGRGEVEPGRGGKVGDGGGKVEG